jgi:hypothetical protein
MGARRVAVRVAWLAAAVGLVAWLGIAACVIVFLVASAAALIIDVVYQLVVLDPSTRPAPSGKRTRRFLWLVELTIRRHAARVADDGGEVTAATIDRAAVILARPGVRVPQLVGAALRLLLLELGGDLDPRVAAIAVGVHERMIARAPYLAGWRGRIALIVVALHWRIANRGRSRGVVDYYLNPRFRPPSEL